ncbi:MAG: DUF1566 domain-containing protein, partial [Desulfobacteraceae bacterium]|nr:DUF1566 domain-containing protein [Desulfobacteraceae bacterium]
VNRAISMKDIEAYSLRIRSKHVLMLFDSCFSGSLFSLVRAVPEDITEKSSLPVRQYITAGTEDESVPDRSMFKRCLLLGLKGDADLTRDGYITGTELGLYLSDKVVKSTNRAQHPQYGKIRTPELARGDFIFHLGKVQAAEPTFYLETERERIAEERARLEREQREFEQLKALAEERKKLQAERKRLEAEKQKLASLPPRQPSTAPRIIYDSKTGLEWYLGPDEDTTWYQARSWVENITVGGGGWRMPTMFELKALYKRGVGTRNMESAFKTTHGWWVWSGETKGSSARDFSFGKGGGYDDWPNHYYSLNKRAFAVRSRVKKW